MNIDVTNANESFGGYVLFCAIERRIPVTPFQAS